MIGRRATFIRAIHKNDRVGFENRRYDGIIIDKFSAQYKAESKFYTCDFYLLEMDNGITEKFFCDEIVNIEKLPKGIEA
jgi:hypothetical protein